MKRTLSLIALVCVVSAAARAQDPNDAEREFRRLLTRDDELMAQRADVRQHQGVERLEHSYRRFLAQHPGHVRAMVAFGSFLDDTGRGDEAMRWWEKALVVDPRAASAYNNIANHYGHTGRAGDALRYYAKAIALAPDEPMFRFNWAVTCSLFRNETHAVYGWDAAEIFRRSMAQLRAARDMAPLEFSYAKAYAEEFYLVPQPDWTEARVAWKVCLGLASDDEQKQAVYCHLARVSIRMKDAEEARLWLTKVESGQFESLRRALERQLAQLDADR